MTDIIRQADPVLPPLALVGFGDIARRIVRQARAQTPDRAILSLSRQLPDSGFDGILGHRLDLDDPGLTLPVDLHGTCLIHLAPPAANGDDDPRTRRLISAIEAQGRYPARVIYISTTGVYGDCKGAWVDETHPLNPANPRSRRRMSAESQWRQSCSRWSVPLVILRVPGIFACERLNLTRVLRQMPVVCPDEAAFSNRIHAEDLAEVCLRLSEADAPVGIFNIADDQPSSMTDYVWQLADHFGVPRSPCRPKAEVMAGASPMLREFLGESKRVRNDKLKTMLGWQPRWPTLASALRDCAQDLQTPT